MFFSKIDNIPQCLWECSPAPCGSQHTIWELQPYGLLSAFLTWACLCPCYLFYPRFYSLHFQGLPNNDFWWLSLLTDLFFTFSILVYSFSILTFILDFLCKASLLNYWNKYLNEENVCPHLQKSVTRITGLMTLRLSRFLTRKVIKYLKPPDNP